MRKANRIQAVAMAAMMAAVMSVSMASVSHAAFASRTYRIAAPESHNRWNIAAIRSNRLIVASPAQRMWHLFRMTLAMRVAG